MPSQHVEVAETIAALRRKLRRDNEVVNGDPTQMATNRGNKLRPGARFVHSGSLPYKYSTGGYKEKINHAGYKRYILGRNPKRYNEYGDELEQSESDSEADADADEENPYAEVRIEDILRPLTHPSELANNPATSYAYLDPALNDMIAATDAKIREERNNLWRAKNLYRHFTGDEPWMPCHTVETPDDWDLFEPHVRLTNGESPLKRRKLDLDPVNQENGVEVQDYMALDEVVEDMKDISHEEVNGIELESIKIMKNGDIEEESRLMQTEPPAVEDDSTKMNGVHTVSDSKKEELIKDTGQSHEDTQHGESDARGDSKMNDDNHQADEATTNGIDEQNSNNPDEAHNSNEEAESTTSTPPPPPRRITRALAAEATNPQSQTVSPPPSPPTISYTSPSAFEPHPIFLLPSSVSAFHAPHPTHAPLTLGLASSGLPPEELLETRKLLSLFIQKSEETIRGFESILGKLIKAKRRRDKVWEWCIAEGHLGEMSDGEDWIDHEAWGLQKEELRKGRDEDGGALAIDGTTAGTSHEAGDENSGVVMGGRKGKRRRAAARD